MSLRQRSWGQWLAYQPLALGLALLRFLPFGMRSDFGGWLIRGPFGRLIGYRKRVMRNLDHVMGHLSQAEKTAIADASLENAGRTIIENLFPESLSANLGEVEIWGDGVDAVFEAHKAGRSIQFISGHFGNHESFRNAMYLRGIPVGGLYRPLANPYFNDFYVRSLNLGGRAGPVFPVGREGTGAYLDHLSAGRAALILLIDISVSRADRIDFLGKPAHTPTSAASFALKTDALYVPYFSMRHGKKHRIEIAAPIPHSDAVTMTKQATLALEERVKADPGNWFWVHRRWKPDV